MFYTLKFIIICLSFISSLSFAKSSCNEINFYDNPNSPLHTMPVCNQGPLGVCYSVAAAQMVNYQLGGNKGRTVSVHPLWIAFLYKKDDKNFSSGLTEKAANVLRRYGICPSPVVEKSIKDFVGKAWVNGYQLFCLVEKYREFYTNAVDSRVAYAKAHRNCLGWGSFNEDIYTKVTDLTKDRYGDLQRPEPHRIAKSIFKSCYASGVIQKPRLKSLDAKCSHCTDSEVKEEISRSLKANKMVGIDYCAEVLNNNKYSGISKGRNSTFQFSNRSNKIIDTEKCGPHASVLVGQKKINNKCHYLLRNSWGKRKYSQWPNCICEEFDGTTVDCQYGQGPYNSVSCWVGADEVTKNTYRIIKY